MYSQDTLDARRFRLLHIHPAIDEDERLECTCIPFEIDNAPAYEALSYVWGPIQQPDEILCNGQSIGIQPSLSSALKRLRLPHSERIIWADAICINQSDNVEKSHQVPLMGSIYSKAERVVVWLGQGHPIETRTAFQALRYIASACYQYNQENGIDDEDYYANHKAVSLPEEAFSSEVCTSLEELFNNPWFSRIWCVQEIQLARDALVLRGHDEIPWADLAMGASWIFDKNTGVSDETDPLVALLDNIETGGVEVMRRKDLGTTTLLENLFNFRRFEASDPRDKVYGLSNLIWPISERDAIEVSYTKSARQVYADTVLVIIRLYSRLSTLAYVGHPKHYAGEEFGDDNEEYDKEYDNHDETFESWAPRWDNVVPVQPLGERDCPWKPSGQYTICVLHEHSQETEPLCLRGILYEKVLDVEDVIEFFASESTFDKLRPLVKVYNSLCTGAVLSYTDEESQRRALRLAQTMLARTMTAGTWEKVARNPQTLDFDVQEKYYEAFIHFMHRATELQKTGTEGEFQHNTDSKRVEYNTFLFCDLRRFFWTENASLGLGPQCMRAGDVVVVLHGGNTPYVLRPKGDKYLFMGQAYVDDIMNGQLMEKLDRGEVQEQDFCLI
jgi:hypothetical protein